MSIRCSYLRSLSVLLVFCVVQGYGTTWVKVDLVAMNVFDFPANYVTVPCNYTKQNPSEVDNIRWTEEHEDGPFVLEKNSAGKITIGDVYENSLRLGDGCSLIFTNHMFKLNSVHTYTVRVDTLNSWWNNTATTVLVVTEKSPILSVRGTTTEQTNANESQHKKDPYIATLRGGVAMTVVGLAMCLSTIGVGIYKYHQYRMSRKSKRFNMSTLEAMVLNIPEGQTTKCEWIRSDFGKIWSYSGNNCRNQSQGDNQEQKRLATMCELHSTL